MCAGRATCCGRSTTPPAGWTGGVRSKLTPRSPTTPRPPSPRRGARGGRGAGPTWSFKIPPPRQGLPATRQGLPAIAACLAEGISINVTLIFSLGRYDAVCSAFLDGMERARQAGRDLSSLASVASFFVSRVDTEVDERLDKIGTPEALALRGKAAIANARLAYQ